MDTNLELNVRVKHVTCDDKIGIVTAILRRSTGTVYGVTWSNDLAERWHSLAELEPVGLFKSPIGFAT